MTPPVLDPAAYEGGACECMACGQNTTLMRRFDKDKPNVTHSHLNCLTCRRVRPHRTEWDGVILTARNGERE